MVSTERTPVRRRWVVGVLVAAILVAGAVWFVRSFVIRDRARAVSVDEAIDQFRAATTPTSAATTTTAATLTTTTAHAVPTATLAPASSLLPSTAPPPSAATPDAGVYRYRTTGSEDVDALGGTTHEYPAETTITVIESGCGVTLRWDALRERREEWAVCATADGIELQPTGRQYHEFYGQGEEELLVCDRPVLIVPLDGEPRDRVAPTCTLADEPWLPVWEVLESTVRMVGDSEVEVLHVRTVIIDEDDYWEDLLTDWYLTSEGLPVEVSSTKRSRSPSIVGPVVYHEQFRLELVWLDPHP